MNLKHLAAASVFAIGSLVSSMAFATPIVGLSNTGASSTAGNQDLNYHLSKTGGDGPAIGAYGYESASNIWPVATGGPWIANSTTSQWLAPLANTSQTFDANSNGIYTWRLIFDLSGFNASSATFSGQWATDNSGQILLNGTALANPSTGFTSWASFSSTGGTFNAGLNYLDFVVTNLRQNGGNPTGLRVEFLNSNVTAVPEPGTLGLLMFGFAALGVSRRRK